MSDFTQDDLFDAIDRLVRDVLERHNIDTPPVDAMLLAQDEFDCTIREEEPEEEEAAPGRFGPRAGKRFNRHEIVFRPDQSEQSRQMVCARACAKGLVPHVLAKLGVETDGQQNRSAASSLMGVITPRFLLPTRWFSKDARKAGYDLEALKLTYPTAPYETMALRLLDLDDPCVIAIVDDGNVSVRRSNQNQVGKKLTSAEERCLVKVGEERDPQKVRHDGWTTQGWPIPNGPFNRIILRSVADDL